MYARLFLCLSLLLTIPMRALAEASVVVLGIRSVEGDDDVANDLTEQLRGAARGVEGWAVSSTAVSVAQMSLAHGCEELDAACLTEIAQGLQADRLIYGVVRRTSARQDFDYVVSLNLFDSGTREISRTVTDTIPRSQVDFQALAAHADRLIGRLSSTASGSAIEIRANVIDAEVEINGQHVGTTHEGGLRLQGLRPGQYRIEIRKPGYAPHVSTVTMVEGADTSISAALSPLAGVSPTSGTTGEARDESAGGSPWLGWTLVGVGAASLLTAGGFALEVNKINNGELFQTYQNAAYVYYNQDRSHDICADAKAGQTYKTTGSTEILPDQVSRVADRCRTGETLTTLQWVLFPVGAVATGVGLYLLLSGGHHGSETAAQQPPRFALTPVLSPRAAGVFGTLRF